MVKAMEQLDLGVRPQDMADLAAGRGRVLDLMADGQWHTADEIRAVARGSEGLRRLRELRHRHTIEKRRVRDSRLFEYRMVQR